MFSTPDPILGMPAAPEQLMHPHGEFGEREPSWKYLVDEAQLSTTGLKYLSGTVASVLSG
ncbi:hypothetical protein [Mycobacterium noviomagense]|uniref:Uncharacterized protein n=1 Tax=Mycobacterium noviomagense TaxID=459858 RepID=A0A7I7PEQ5_9MYCO|nr:hypothetical protein [Mycobacterium noviomagense]ORB12679.1 hypothetical protein BST37_15655 [Mycobacterium noviomagense]BBY07098.1 hypothetical protein MNVI_24160 [Mycobacterium noviomagense]